MSALLAGGILEIGAKLIDKLIPNSEAKAKAHMELIQLQRSGDLKELEISMSAILAEANSNDPWTSRARPSFLYVMYAVIILCFVGGVIGIWHAEAVQLAAANINALLSAIPEEMWWLFGAGYLGYTGSRTYEKAKKK